MSALIHPTRAGRVWSKATYFTSVYSPPRLQLEVWLSDWPPGSQLITLTTFKTCVTDEMLLNCNIHIRLLVYYKQIWKIFLSLQKTVSRASCAEQKEDLPPPRLQTILNHFQWAIYVYKGIIQYPSFLQNISNSIGSGYTTVESAQRQGIFQGNSNIYVMMVAQWYDVLQTYGFVRPRHRHSWQKDKQTFIFLTSI